MSLSFGRQAFLINWDSKHVRNIMAAVEVNHEPLAGVRLSIIKMVDPDEAQWASWGDCWVAVSLPRDLFLKIEAEHLKDNGTMDLTHAVSATLFELMPPSE